MIASVPEFLRALPADQTTPCTGQGPLFTSEDERNIAVAKTLCAACPIREACRDHALANGEPAGVWGGLTPDERAATLAPACGTEAAWRRHTQREEGCVICREAHDERLRADRIVRLAAEHTRPEGGSLAGYRLELLLGMSTCARCRAARREYYAARPRSAKWYRRGSAPAVASAA